MGKHNTNWEKVFKDCAKLISESSAGNEPIVTAAKLYQELIKYYQKSENPITVNEKAFRYNLRKKLNLKEGERIQNGTLYLLTGQYYKMSVQNLAGFLKLQPLDESAGENFLFLRLNSNQKSTKSNQLSDNLKILNTTAKQIKEKFPKEAVFVSYDRDTIVILCHSSKDKKVISDYLSEKIEIGEE